MKELPGARHLTTLMCAKHRSKVLDEIRKDLKQGRPCRLVSTSLIEAGVDVDFPLVLRAETGLDSIAQAAGRCNREGKQPVAESEVLVFTPANEDWKAPPELKQFAEVAATLFRKRGEAGDLLSPDAIHAYFEELYFRKGQAALDSGYLLKQLQSCQLDSLPMETLATEFRMIETVLMPVIIPYDEEACKVLNKMRFSDKIGESARKLQPYLVQVSRAAFKSLHNLNVIQTIAPEKWGEQFVVLTDMQYYDSHTGLYWDEEPESWVW
jgi:CRISPR-associated endonuclease/helicase Cas3